MGSLRQQQEIVRFRDELQREEQQQREADDKREYSKYAAQMRSNDLEPVSFEQWRSNTTGFEDATPQVRGAVATSRSMWTGTVGSIREMVTNQALSDDVLREFGYDPESRVHNADLELSPLIIRAGFEQFSASEPRYDFRNHYKSVGEFLIRNKLFPSVQHISLTWHLLNNMALLPQPEPEPQPQPTVNLEIEPDPEIQRRKRLRDYEETPILRFEGRDYTQKMLDQMDSETYARVTRLKRISGWNTPSTNI